MKKTETFQDRVAVVTGGSSGIGMGIARRLAYAGARVVICSRSEAKLRTANDALAEAGSCITHAADVGTEAGVAGLIQYVRGMYGRLDILVHAAGITVKKPATELSLDDWYAVMDTNLTSAFLLAKYGYPLLRANEDREPANYGKFLVVGSIGSYQGIPGSVAYCASKAGLLRLIDVLAIEWAQDRIAVNAVIPGYILTPLSQSVLARDDVYEQVVSRIPMKKLGSVEDTAAAAIYLLSQESNYVTGACLKVDGGFLSAAYTAES